MCGPDRLTKEALSAVVGSVHPETYAVLVQVVEYSHQLARSFLDVVGVSGTDLPNDERRSHWAGAIDQKSKHGEVITE